MKWWGLVIEELTHDDERQRTERRHLLQRRAARREARRTRRQPSPASEAPATPVTGRQRPAAARAVPWSGA